MIIAAIKCYSSTGQDGASCAENFVLGQPSMCRLAGSEVFVTKRGVSKTESDFEGPSASVFKNTRPSAISSRD